jgi:N-hydroxyarylamine O-acetyltransferase
MSTVLDLEAYFHRIGYAGPGAATLETLRAVHLRHTESIAFENLNPLLRWPVRLDLPSLEQKIVREGRGGYCFEQNLLFGHALQALGFRVIGLGARVLWNMPEDVITPRSHMLLRVDVDGTRYVADAGFGVLTLTGPLRLEPDIEQMTPHEPFRLVRMGDEFLMQADMLGEWKSLYRFSLQEQFLPDYEVANWYLSTHPDSYFMTGLMAARPDPDCRYALRNNEFKVHALNGTTERRIIMNPAELRKTLEEPFRVKVPNAPEVDALLERLAAQAA